MSRRDRFLELRDQAPQILPSMLLCDFRNLEREVARLHAAGVRGLHLDVMDGMFVPNLTYGMPLVKAFRQLTDLVLDVHLMIAQPERYLEQFYEAGADAITIHVEATDQPIPALRKIRALGASAGLAFNPGTALETIEGYTEYCDLMLPMSVEAGFGGQTFQPVAVEKMHQLRRRLAGLTLEADGGINRQTIAACAAAGAQLFVVGSALFQSPDYGAVVGELSALARTVLR